METNFQPINAHQIAKVMNWRQQIPHRIAHRRCVHTSPTENRTPSNRPELQINSQKQKENCQIPPSSKIILYASTPSVSINNGNKNCRFSISHAYININFFCFVQPEHVLCCVHIHGREKYKLSFVISLLANRCDLAIIALVHQFACRATEQMRSTTRLPSNLQRQSERFSLASRALRAECVVDGADRSTLFAGHMHL